MTGRVQSYSRFQFAFEKSLRMFVFKLGMFVAKFQRLFGSSFRQFIYDEPALQVLIGCHNKSANQIAANCSLFNRRKYSERASKQTLELCDEHSELTNEQVIFQ